MQNPKPCHLYDKVFLYQIPANPSLLPSSVYLTCICTIYV